MIAIDPGPDRSGWVEMSGGIPVHHDHSLNRDLLEVLHAAHSRVELCALEWLQSYGMPAGQDVFRTALWVGRFVERFPGPSVLVSRPTVKAHVCNSARAKDAHVRQALIDRYGGDQRLRGVKCSTCRGRGKVGLGRARRDCPVWEIEPGPVAGFASHHWSALAVAVTVIDRGVTCGVLVEGSPW